MTPMAEQRAFQRRTERLAVRYRVAPDDAASMAQMRDLSGGGIGLVLREPFRPGTKLLVELDLMNDHGPWARVTGQVVWSEPAVRIREPLAWKPIAVGLKFVRIDAADPRLHRRLFP